MLEERCSARRTSTSPSASSARPCMRGGRQCLRPPPRPFAVQASMPLATALEHGGPPASRTEQHALVRACSTVRRPGSRSSIACPPVQASARFGATPPGCRLQLTMCQRPPGHALNFRARPLARSCSGKAGARCSESASAEHVCRARRRLTSSVRGYGMHCAKSQAARQLEVMGGTERACAAHPSASRRQRSQRGMEVQRRQSRVSPCS